MVVIWCVCVYYRCPRSGGRPSLCWQTPPDAHLPLQPPLPTPPCHLPYLGSCYESSPIQVLELKVLPIAIHFPGSDLTFSLSFLILVGSESAAARIRESFSSAGSGSPMLLPAPCPGSARPRVGWTDWWRHARGQSSSGGGFTCIRATSRRGAPAPTSDQ